MNSHYGVFGGQYVSETLMPTLLELEKEYEKALNDPSFKKELKRLLKYYVGRETPLYEADRLTEYCGGARIFLKREDLNHTGAHKINNTIGQALLAKQMKRSRLIAETGAGMHGVATATAAALFGMKCEIFMGALDIDRQHPNVEKMEILGASIHSVSSGSATLKDAMNEAIRDWTARVDDSFYVLGTTAGPHPYPKIVRDFQSVIGREAKNQCLEQTGQLPCEVIACVGGGSNAMGIFAGFLDCPNVRLTGVEAAGKGIDTDFNAASINRGRIGVLHGSKCRLLQDDAGQIREAYSVSAGLDYPGVGPEHCLFAENGIAQYTAINDEEAVKAFQIVSQLEGIIPALESSHALAQAIKTAPRLDKNDIIIVNLSGRGDKDMENIRNYLARHR